MPNRSAHRRPAAWLLPLLLAAGACRFARSDVPEWIETHGRGQLSAIAADFEGAVAVGGNRRIYNYPGPYGQPWTERLQQEGALIAAGGGVVAWTGPDGVVRTLPPGGVPREVPGSREWRATALALGPDGILYVVSQARAWSVAGDSLGEPVCDGGPALMIAVGSSGPHVVRTDGTVVARRAGGGPCQPVQVPFFAIDLAAAGDNLAAVDREGNAWRRRRNTWEKLPQPRVYRADSFPADTTVRQVAMTESVLWARSDAGWVFILSDPT